MPKLFFDIPAPPVAQQLRIGQLYGSSRALLLAEQIESHDGLSVIVCSDMSDAEQLEQELGFFCRELPPNSRSGPSPERARSAMLSCHFLFLRRPGVLIQPSKMSTTILYHSLLLAAIWSFGASLVYRACLTAF